MGGRGSSSGVSDKGKVYGTEFRSLLTSGNIEFVKYNDSKVCKSPIETMTKGRVYANITTIDGHDEVKNITFYDKNNRKYKSIDVIGQKHMIDGEAVLPHTHKGYLHSEKGTHKLSTKETRIVEKVLKIWYYHKSKE